MQSTANTKRRANLLVVRPFLYLFLLRILSLFLSLPRITPSYLVFLASVSACFVFLSFIFYTYICVWVPSPFALRLVLRATWHALFIVKYTHSISTVYLVKIKWFARHWLRVVVRLSYISYQLVLYTLRGTTRLYVRDLLGCFFVCGLHEEVSRLPGEEDTERARPLTAVSE